MNSNEIYTLGGTIRSGEGVYVFRKADEELLNLCRRGMFSYILTPRQMGKSSLMVRTAEKLDKEGICTTIVDLTKLGTETTSEQWYFSLLNEIKEQLDLKANVLEWWRANMHFGITPRLIRFFTDVVLNEVTAPIVVFIDEIDMTLSLNFANDFFAAIRSLYNERASNKELVRLTFVLIGVATPSDLIRDPNSTPFNVGVRVDLEDFSLAEAAPLAKGLGVPISEEQVMLKAILEWTGGHPYLTQSLCHEISLRTERTANIELIDATVRQVFLGEQSESDGNLQFVRDMLLIRPSDPVKVLEVYRDIRLNKKSVRDEEQSIPHVHLKLSGIVRRKEGNLVIRNKIYSEAFDANWIKHHWPLNWWQGIPKTVRVVSGFTVVLLIAFIGISFLLLQELNSSETLRLLAESSQAEAVAQAQTAESSQAEAVAQAQTAESSQAEAVAQAQTAEVANERLLIADIQRLVSNTQSVIAANGDPELALLLALEAARFSKSKGIAVAENQLRDLLRSAILNSFVRIRMDGHAGPINTAIYSPDGQFIATASNDGTAIIWNASTGLPVLPPLVASGGAMLGAVFSPNSQKVMTYGVDGIARIWDINSGNIDKALQGHTASITTAEFSPNGKFVATGSVDNSVRIWDITTNTNNMVATINSFSDRVSAVTFSPDSTRLAISSWDGTFLVYDLLRNEDILRDVVSNFDGASSRVMKVVFSPRGRYILVASDNFEGYIWDVDDKFVVLKITGHIDSVQDGDFSLDGKYVVTASDDWTLQVRGIVGGAQGNLRERFFLNGHTAPINNVVWNEDYILSSSDDGTARLWQFKSRKNFLVFRGHTDTVVSANFSPDGKFVVTGGVDGTSRVWTIAQETINPNSSVEVLLELAKKRVTRELTDEEKSLYLNFVSESP